MPTQPSGDMTVSLTRGTKRPADPHDNADYGRMLHPSQRQNEKLVAQHYNARPEVGTREREYSPIFGLKSFNNWIKAVMIAKFARPAIKETNSRPEEVKLFGTKRRPKYLARVLDLGCGKGGDLGKWAKAEIAQYVGVDIADVSVEQARSRWVEQRRKTFDAEFFAVDCYTVIE
jgi:mRNA (guanine-N7-)-methyltransferase